MASNSYEGITIVLDKDSSFTITPNMMEIDLSGYDIEKLYFKYEERHCGCCEGSHCTKELDPKDLFDFIDAGGKEKIKEVKETNEELVKENDKLKRELKKYSDVIGELKK